MKHKILIIDNSVMNINALYVMLKDSYQIFVAKDGKDGIREAMNTEFSMILLNVLMPEMDGFEVLERLMREPLTKRIPVMFITGQNDDKAEERGLILGAVDRITKPFNPSIIKAKVTTHIELFEYRKMMENIALLDGLTGIPNRRSYNERIVECWESARREQSPISVAILDIDYFKEYNDNYGHLQGDKVLKQVAKELMRRLPAERGFLARYGGEEFVVILKGVEEQDAKNIIDEMREGIKRLGIEHVHSQAEPVVTMSAGGATIVPTHMEIEQLVDMADKRLYRAKSAGRNCTVWEDGIEVKGQVEVSMFGHLRLRTAAGELTYHKEIRSPIWLLLSFLVINRKKEYTKQELIHAVWPNQTVADAGYEIRMLLEELRMELLALNVPYAKELVVTINGVYHWNNAYQCKVDTEKFDELYKQVKSEQEDRTRYRLCERMVSLYAGELLEKMAGIEWVLELRKCYKARQVEMIEILLELYYRNQEYEKMLPLCQREFYHDYFEDKIHYFYLKALLACKRNKEALNHYEYILESYYARNFIEPPLYLMSLYQEIVGIEKEKNGKIDQIEQLLKEPSIAVGAYYCDLHVFKNIYQIEARSMTRDGADYYLALIDMDKSRYYDKAQRAIHMHDLFVSIKRGLRIGDVFCKINETQYVILFPCSSSEEAHLVMGRILDEFYKNYAEDNIPLGVSLMEVKPAETLHRELETVSAIE